MTFELIRVNATNATLAIATIVTDSLDGALDLEHSLENLCLDEMLNCIEVTVSDTRLKVGTNEEVTANNLGSPATNLWQAALVVLGCMICCCMVVAWWRLRGPRLIAREVTSVKLHDEDGVCSMKGPFRRSCHVSYAWD